MRFKVSQFQYDPKGDPDQWERYVRDFEVKKAMNGFEKEHFANGLELGCGSGRHSRHLAHYCQKLIAMEYNEERLFEKSSGKITFKIGDAQDLSCFNDAEFDLIFSSNLIEHLPNIDGCISECARVSKEGGVIIHMVPNRTWKIFNFCLYYPYLVKTILSRAISKFKPGHMEPTATTEPQLDMNLNRHKTRSFLHKFIPAPPHGISETHWREFAVWGEKNWIDIFENNGLEVVKVIRQPFYTGYESDFNALLRLGNYLGWSSCTGYILRKT